MLAFPCRGAQYCRLQQAVHLRCCPFDLPSVLLGEHVAREQRSSKHIISSVLGGISLTLQASVPICLFPGFRDQYAVNAFTLLKFSLNEQPAAYSKPAHYTACKHVHAHAHAAHASCLRQLSDVSLRQASVKRTRCRQWVQMWQRNQYSHLRCAPATWEAASGVCTALFNDLDVVIIKIDTLRQPASLGIYFCQPGSCTCPGQFLPRLGASSGQFPAEPGCDARWQAQVRGQSFGG